MNRRYVVIRVVFSFLFLVLIPLLATLMLTFWVFLLVQINVISRGVVNCFSFILDFFVGFGSAINVRLQSGAAIE